MSARKGKSKKDKSLNDNHEKKHDDLKSSKNKSVHLKNENKEKKKVEKKQIKETRDYSLLKKILLILSITLFSIFILFLIWQIYAMTIKHFIDYLPRENTVLGAQIEVNNNFQQNHRLRQWVFQKIAGNQRLSFLGKDNLELLLSGDFELGLAFVGDRWVVGVRPLNFKLADFYESLNEFINRESADSGELVFSDEDHVFYRTDGKIIFFAADQVVFNKLRFKDNSGISYQGLVSELPERNYFSHNDVLYFSRDKYYKYLVDSKQKFFDGVAIDELQNTSLVDDDMIAALKFSDNKLFIDGVLKESNVRLISAKYNGSRTISCQDNNEGLIMSGINLADDWKKLHTALFNNNYSLLQYLSYSYIRDIYDKTQFDLESELIFKIKQDYCFKYDLSSDGGAEYLLKFDYPNGFDFDSFARKMEIVFLRYSSLIKPRLKNYELEDGTKASEWIIDTDYDLHEETRNTNGFNVKDVYFGDEDKYLFSIADNGKQVIIGSDQEMLSREAASLEVLDDQDSKSVISANIDKLINSDMGGGFINDEKNKFSKFLNGIKKLDFYENGYNRFKIVGQF